MSSYFNALAQQILQKPLDETSVQELQKLTTEYPYFAPAQFLLLKKLDPGSEQYRDQFQKAILYYKNPPAFEYFIRDEHFEIALEEEKNAPESVATPEIIETPTEEVPVHEEETKREEPEIINEPEVVAEIDNVEPAKEEVSEPLVEEPQNEIVTSQEVSEPVAPADEKSTPVEEAAPLSFEPYHTIDYFASQGIKLSASEATNDRFGKQLKSFTEWLRTMKRLPAGEAAKSKSPEADLKVINMAEHSVKNPEVVTEAMAEVWLKQGDSEKAAEVYRKLSLLNPSKRAYFAAKIDDLKKAT